MGVEVESLTWSTALPVGKAEIHQEFTTDNPGEMGAGARGRVFNKGMTASVDRLDGTASNFRHRSPSVSPSSRTPQRAGA